MKQDQKHALVKTQLQLPLIIRDVLTGQEALDDTALYAMSDLLSGYNPDQALLSCAMAMKEIAEYKNCDAQDLAFLKLECDLLIERYTSRLEIAQEQPELWAETQTPMMLTLLADIESFMEITSLCQLSFEIMDERLAKITHIMNAQLQSQYMIVDQVVELLNDVEQALKVETPSMTGYAADNVVMFPC